MTKKPSISNVRVRKSPWFTIAPNGKSIYSYKALMNTWKHDLENEEEQAILSKVEKFIESLNSQNWQGG